MAKFKLVFIYKFINNAVDKSMNLSEGDIGS